MPSAVIIAYVAILASDKKLRCSERILSVHNRFMIHRVLFGCSLVGVGTSVTAGTCGTLLDMMLKMLRWAFEEII